MASPILPSNAPTMRAWTHIVRGKPSTVLSLNTIPRPSLVANSVLIRVSHASLNPGGALMLQLLPTIFRTKPCIPELDFSGTIEEVGSSVSSSLNLSPRTPVFGSIPVGAHVSSTCGALAEYVVVPAGQVTRKPENISFEEAAGLGIAGATAISCVERAELKKGWRVCVYGASGGIGSIVVQLCRNIVGETGEVVAICSGRNADMVRRCGASEVVDYQVHAPVYKYLAENYSNPRFDVIIDAFGIQDVYMHCGDYLAEGRPFVSVGPAFKDYSFLSMLGVVYSISKNRLWPRFLGGPPREYANVASITDAAALEKLRKLVEEEKIKIPVDSVWDFEDALKAYDILLNRRARGKVIIKVQGQ